MIEGSGNQLTLSICGIRYIGHTPCIDHEKFSGIKKNREAYILLDEG